jgi:alpha-L-rhamnosidase
VHHREGFAPLRYQYLNTVIKRIFVPTSCGARVVNLLYVISERFLFKSQRMQVAFSLGLLGVASAANAASCVIVPTHLSVDNKQLGPFSNPASDLAIVTDRATPWLSWWLAASPLVTNQTQSAYRLQVATSLAGFAECDGGGGPSCLWDSNVVSSSVQGVAYGGALLPSFSSVVWRVSVWDGDGSPCGSGPEWSAWEVPLLSEADWHGAAWLTRDAPHPPLTDCELYQPDPAPLFRAALELPPSASVVRARAWVTGLGYYTLHVDGTQVGNAALDPGVTSYNETVLYSTYDLTSVLTAQGGVSHVVGVALGNGWFNLLPLRMWGSKEFRLSVATGDPMFRLLVRVELSSGPNVWLASSLEAAWLVGPSEVLRNSIYLGAVADGRLRPGNWTAPDFNATGWQAPFLASTTVGSLRAQAVPPVRRQAALPIVSSHIAGDALVLDAGRNIAGVCEFCMAGAPGATLTFRYGELLFANGSVNGWTSVAGQIKGPGVGGPCAPAIAWQEDTYTLRGDVGGECWVPPFTWRKWLLGALS